MNIDAAITLSPVGGFPAGTVVNHLLLTAVGSNPANTFSTNLPATATTGSLSGVAADTYAVTVQAQDINNTNLGPPAKGTITVAPPTITLNLPTAVSLSQS